MSDELIYKIAKATEEFQEPIIRRDVIIWKKAQQELLEEIKNHFNEITILKETLNGLTKHESYHIGVRDCITIIMNKQLKLSNK